MNRSILIIHTAFIGDIVLTTPLIEAISEDLPGYSIDFLTIPASVNLIESNPKLRRVIVFDKRGKDRGLQGLLRLSRELAHEHYKICISPHRSLRSAFLCYKTAAEVRVGFDRSAWRQAFNKVIPYQPEIHEIGRNLSLLRALGFRHQTLIQPKIYSTEEDKEVVRNLLFNRGLIGQKNIVALAPGSVWETKRWPQEHYQRLSELLIQNGWEVILIGGKADINLCQQIAKSVPGCHSFAGELTLRQSYQLLCLSKALVTNDSAPLHIAMAAGIHVFAIFGATVPAFGFAPFGEKAIIVEQENLSCRPCGIHGGKNCPTKTFDCMIRTTPEQVYRILFEQLGKRDGISQN